MKGISAAIILISMTAGSAADAAIRCQDAPGREQHGVYWSWREIDGKRCWFIRASGAMPPKSAFAWVKEKAVEKDVPAVAEKTKMVPTIQMLRVRPDYDLFEVRANWLDDAPVDLIVGEDLLKELLMNPAVEAGSSVVLGRSHTTERTARTGL